MVEKVKLHLGCGTKRLSGWVNIDLQQSQAVDVIDDATILSTVKEESADEIYASHILEHVSRDKLIPTLVLWCSKLRQGGRLRVAVPDFDSVCNVYLKNRSIEEVIGLVSGGREGRLDEHKIIFNFDYLKKCLIEAGFESISRYDWRKTEHSHVDDYSQAYLPHMQKETGVLMSLNVSAMKKGDNK